MKIIASIDRTQTPTAIALGNFDGIHQGHQLVLQPILEEYRGKSEDICPSVVSFSPHPREFFTGTKIRLLTPVKEKAEYLATLGFQQLILVPFDRQTATLTPEEFIREILVEQLKTVQISVGEDFRFGHSRKGTVKELKEIASKFGIRVSINSLRKFQHKEEEVRISSSLIRKTLLAGDIIKANCMLGRPYILRGKVIKGQQLGRTIGFPTANLELPKNKFLPRLGVYKVKVSWDSFNILGVMNVGTRPTVSGEEITAEVHLLNWSGNLYDKEITVSLENFIRGEKQFDSLEALKQQIAVDCQKAID